MSPPSNRDPAARRAPRRRAWRSTRHPTYDELDEDEYWIALQEF